MIRRVAFQKGMEVYAKDLEEFGFELFPYVPGVTYDAVIYDGSHHNGILKRIQADEEVFVLNTHEMAPSSAADKLKARLYSSLF